MYEKISERISSPSRSQTAVSGSVASSLPRGVWMISRIHYPKRLIPSLFIGIEIVICSVVALLNLTDILNLVVAIIGGIIFVALNQLIWDWDKSINDNRDELKRKITEAIKAESGILGISTDELTQKKATERINKGTKLKDDLAEEKDILNVDYPIFIIAMAPSVILLALLIDSVSALGSPNLADNVWVVIGIITGLGISVFVVIQLWKISLAGLLKLRKMQKVITHGIHKETDDFLEIICKHYN